MHSQLSHPPLADAQELLLIRSIQQHLEAVDVHLKRDPKRTLEEARKALGLAEQLAQRHWRAQCWNALGKGYAAGGDFDKAIAWFKKAAHYFEGVDDPEHLIMTLDNLSHIESFADRHAESLQTELRALEVARNADESRLSPALRSKLLGRLYYHLAGNYNALGDYGASLKFLKESMSVRTEIDPVDLAQLYDQMAANYGALDDMETALAYGRKALESIEAYDLPFDKGIILGNLGSIYHAVFTEDRSPDTLATAIDLLHQARQNFRATGFRNRELFASFVLGRVYVDAEDDEQALRWFSDALDKASELALDDTSARLLTGIAGVHRGRGHLAEAEKYLERVVSLLPESQPESCIDFFHEKYLSCKMRGDLEQSLNYYEQYVSLYRELLGAEQRKAAAVIKARFEAELAEKGRALVQKDNDLLKQRSRMLQAELELKSKRVTMTGMLLGQRNELLMKVKRALSAAVNDMPAARGKLDSTVGLIDANINPRTSWEVFNDEFAQLHGDFISELARRYPQLTQMELRVCALIKINLSNKEIARLLCIGARSVETYRHRIRKKIRLDRKDNLTALLASL